MRIICVLFVLSAVVIASVSSSASERQNQCSNLPDIPQNCQNTFFAFHTEFELLASQFSDLAALNRTAHNLERTLDVLCANECSNPFLASFECRNQTQDIKTFMNTLCGREGETFCPIKLLQANISGSPLLPNCASDGDCRPSCEETLRTLRIRAGCCAASIYTIPSLLFQRYSRVSSQFMKCRVSLGNICSGAAGWSTRVQYLCILLLLEITVLILS